MKDLVGFFNFSLVLDLSNILRAPPTVFFSTCCFFYLFLKVRASNTITIATINIITIITIQVFTSEEEVSVVGFDEEDGVG